MQHHRRLSTVSANTLRRAEQQTDRKKVAVRKQIVVTFLVKWMAVKSQDLSNDIS